MSENLLEVTRGELVENIHRGDIAVVGKDGKLKYYKGDPYKVTYLRSSLKPIQALNVFLSGAAEKYDFDDKEIAIMCASHYGEDLHKEVVDKILKKIGLNESNLLCKEAYSINEKLKDYQIANHIKLTPANSDCSGKHCGMLASCLAKGYSIENYNSMDNPLQQDIKKIIAGFCEVKEDKIVIGTDGCGVPVHGISLYNAALGFAKFTFTDDLEPKLKNACERIFNAMNNYPEMVAGTGGFCTELMKHSNGKLIGKIGADGVYCLAVKGMDVGIAIKIEDGNMHRAVPPVVMRCLEELNVLTTSEMEALKRFRHEHLINSLGEDVGKVNPVFHLNEA